MLNKILDTKTIDFTERPMPPEQVDCLNQLTLEQVIYQIFVTRKISRLDQQLLRCNLTKPESMTMKEKSLLDQVFDALNEGVLQVV